ncbi:MAG: O-antigen ligase family protein [Candidatus Margulisbacteria bacterium]|nr:O-antigen ligase family protein [Candidatus Margulisiibacteriota bacterium]
MKRAINGLLLVLIFGIPIFFTSVTRSVFEVNKLLLLRFTTILIGMLWVTKALLVDYEQKEEDEAHKGKPYYNFLGLRWYKTGLEIPIVLWLILNFISTLVSRNIYVSIIGAYDRWEGIMTVINYAFLVLIFAKMVDSIRLFYWIFFSFIISASMSAIYGIFQSAGMDFMQWSADATARAFGSINNPVHYGPYIGMMITLAFGYMLQVKHFQDKMKPILYHILYYVSFVLTIVIYYAMFLSWGRGTWLGFQGALTFFLLFITKLFDSSDKKSFFMDFIFTILIVAVTYVVVLFKVYKVMPIIILPAVFAVFAFYYYWIVKICKKSPLNFVERIIIIILAYQIQQISISFIYFLYYMLCLAILFFIHIKVHKKESIFLQNRLVMVVLFSFGFILIAPTVTDFLIYLFFLCSGYILTLFYSLIKDKSAVIVGGGVIIIICLIILVPQHSLFQKILEAKKGNTSHVIDTATNKINSYKTEAISGKSARMSMWKSGIVWGLKNPLFGTGPDTVKEMYPFYRRVEYARLEGGHNLTPDRLHNEYVNTLATTGVTGLILRYIVFIGVYLFLIVSYLYKNLKNPSYYLILSTLTGFIFYQGQVLFNFGVVATASLNYMLMGLGLAIGYYNLGNKNE